MPKASGIVCAVLSILAMIGAARCDRRGGLDQPQAVDIIGPAQVSAQPADMDLPPAREEPAPPAGHQGPPSQPAPQAPAPPAIAPPGPSQGLPGGALVPVPLAQATKAEQVRKVHPSLPPILADVLSRVDRPYFWRDPTDLGDVVTWCHEATHAMTSQVKGRHGFTLYVLDGRALVFEAHPRMTLAQVASDIPPAERGQLFPHYLVEQRRYWDAEPLYILDEWNSYIHGSICRRQVGWQKRGETERFAREMERYSRQVLASAKKRDPEYPELGQLEAAIDWQAARFRDACGPAENVLR
jgi:hypothetical protein